MTQGADVTGRVLVCDDERALRDSLALVLAAQGHEVERAPTGERALELLSQTPFDAMVLDLRLPGLSGLETLRQALCLQPDCMVLIITAHASVDSAVEALKLGAFDYLRKPLSFDDVQVKLSRLLSHRALLQQNRLLRRELSRGLPAQDSLATISPAMAAVVDMVGRVSRSSARVLISGESGTGKEVVARAIHDRSAQRTGPFVAVNMAALPEPLLESQLFGHVKGAFTGAGVAQEGLVRGAAGGTLLLDEIGEAPLALQAKLLRLVDQGEFIPVGASRPIKSRTRILAATNRDLLAESRRGNFREDLYYRLSVVELRVPPLRERREDMPRLVERLLHRCGASMGCSAQGVGPDVLRVFMTYSWPGNVRELANVIERACCLGDGERVQLDDLPDELANLVAPVDADSNARLDLRQAVRSMERAQIVTALQAAEGSRRVAAELLGIGLASLYRKLDQYQLGDQPVATAD